MGCFHYFHLHFNFRYFFFSYLSLVERSSLFMSRTYNAHVNFPFFRQVALLNVATFILFRIILLGWMTRWITVNRDHVPALFFAAGSIGLATIITMNAVLFYRILSKDFAFAFRASGIGVGGGAASDAGASDKAAVAAPAAEAVAARGGDASEMQNVMRSIFDGEDDESSSSSSAESSKKGSPKASSSSSLGVRTRRSARRID